MKRNRSVKSLNPRQRDGLHKLEVPEKYLHRIFYKRLSRI